MASLIDKIKSIGSLPSKIRATSQKAVDWFRNKVGSLKAKRITSPTKFLKAQNYDTVSRPVPGRMYSYQYDPKLKQTLPYWDQFPLILCVALKKDGFTGINLHYIKPKHRALLLAAIMKTIDDKHLGDNAKLQINYKMLKKASKFSMFKPTFKRYLTTHIKSPLIQIDPDDYLLVVFLPLQKFHGASAEKVWKDSATMY